MDPKAIDLTALPQPIQEMLGKMDPAALNSLLASLDGEELQSLLAGAMGYVKNMPASEKDAFNKFLDSVTKD